MTPTQPLAALAVGTLLGLAAWMAPDSSADPDTGAPPCVTDCTGSAQSLPVVGTVADMAQAHPITSPARYGLTNPPQGQAYAVLSGQLVRVRTDNHVIMSVLRPAPQILD